MVIIKPQTISSMRMQKNLTHKHWEWEGKLAPQILKTFDCFFKKLNITYYTTGQFYSYQSTEMKAYD